jgi:CRP-like cAMP-binding protein
VLVLAAGRVRVSRLEANGNEVTIATRGPGEILGDLSALDEGVCSASVTTLTPCIVHVVSVGGFRRLIRSRDLMELAVHHAVNRLREGEELRVELATLSVARRVAKVLVRLTGQAEKEVTGVSVAASQEELAKMVGASRNAIVNALSELRSLGIVRTSRCCLTIRNLHELRCYAEGKVSLQESASTL